MSSSPGGTSRRTLVTAALLVFVAGGSGIAWLIMRSPAGRWVSTAAMANGRSDHTATRLPDGRVLVTGGWGAGNTAEIFDPVSTKWSAAKIMPTLRYRHSAVLLPSGRVLLTGGLGREGSGGDHALGLVDVYDPSSDSWSRAAPMAHSRGQNTATLLQDGRVLILGGAGGLNSRGHLGSAELFDSASNTWVPAAAMVSAPAAMSCHTATLLRDGKVLVTGGYDVAALTVGSYTLNSAEVFDPATNTWALATPMKTPREFHTATLLPDGRVLVVGGNLYSQTKWDPYSSTEIYDTSNNTWTDGPPMATGRSGHTASLLPSGRVLVVGGGPETSETFDPAVNKWAPPVPLAAQSVHHTAATATLLADGRVLIAGGLAPEQREVHSEMVGKELQNVSDATAELWSGKEKPDTTPQLKDAFPTTLSKACDKSNPHACVALADLIAQSPGASGEQQKILELFENGCAGNIVYACKRGAEMYKNGVGSAADPRKAIGLLARACHAGDMPACTVVAIAVQRGDGVPQDLSEAAKLLTFACDGAKGTGAACVLIALAYENGTGVAKDSNKALAIYERGCAAQDQEICGALGGFLMEAQPPIGDEARGRSLSEKACKLGNPAACQWLRQVGPAPTAAGINLPTGAFAATTPQWKAATDAVVAWCGANAGKCTEQALDDLKKPADGVLTVGAGAEATLTTCSPGECLGATFVEFKKAGTAWNVTKVEWSPMGD